LAVFSLGRLSSKHDACTTEQDEILLSKQVLSIGYSHQLTPQQQDEKLFLRGKKT